VYSPSLSEIAGAEIWLKLENMQVTGSFKMRGVSNKMMQLSDAEKAAGVVTVSTGNHGRAMAAFAREIGIRAVICGPSSVPGNKTEAIRSFGAEVRLIGDTQDEAQLEADRLVAEEGLTWVAPFDDPTIIAGQGTIALEIVEELPDVDAIVAPLAGGGLLSGIAVGAKSLDPRIEVIGTSMEVEPGMVRSLEAGHPISVAEFPSLADALGGSIGLNNQYTFPLVQELMDEAILIAEDELAPTMRHIFRYEGIVIEGGSAAAPAAAYTGKLSRLKGKKIAVVISSRNIDPQQFQDVVLASRGGQV
jgi:threonine dehydratase